MRYWRAGGELAILAIWKSRAGLPTGYACRHLLRLRHLHGVNLNAVSEAIYSATECAANMVWKWLLG